MHASYIRTTCSLACYRLSVLCTCVGVVSLAWFRMHGIPHNGAKISSAQTRNDMGLVKKFEHDASSLGRPLCVLCTDICPW